MDKKLPSIDIVELCSINNSEILSQLGVSLNGLSTEEASLRHQTYGKNILAKAKSIHPLMQLLKQFIHFMALLLWAAGFLAIIAGMPELAVATWTVIIINAFFAFFQEFRADKALSELAHMLPQKVKIYRDSEVKSLPAEEITIGDLIILEAGNNVPADARIIEASGLFVDNSLLTGESVPVDRNAESLVLNNSSITESTNLVFAGTTVTEGKALAVVYAIANQTELGKVSKLTQTIKRGESTLEVQVHRIVKFITKLALVLGLLAFSMAVFGVGLDIRIGFIFAIGIIVANIPEGLLPTVSMSLAVGVQRMAKQNALIRRLSAVETLSSVSVICTDKTGTITANQLTVEKIWTPEATAFFEGSGYEKEGSFRLINNTSTETSNSKTNNQEINTDNRYNNLIRTLLTVSAVCSEANISDNNSDPKVWKIFGAPTEAALLIAAAKFGLNVDNMRNDFQRINTLPFNSERKMMSVVVKNIRSNDFEPTSDLSFTKGAPLEVLKTCKYIYMNNSLSEITEEIRAEIIKNNDEIANQGYRVLGIAHEILDKSLLSKNEGIFLGLTAMADPPRPEVYEAINQCQKAGIKTTIITGDYGITAASIARQVGLIIDGHHIITGSGLDEMSDAQLELLLKKSEPLIFSRTTPEHKLRIVEAYKKIGEIVAVTGDGINDTLALKSSHIGIAMGQGGTDVAREVADMVLLDNNFATIIKAVEEGRSIYSNIRKFMTYVLTSNLAEFLPFVAMILFKIPPSLTILQILAIDLGTDMLPALALGVEKPEKGVLNKPPMSIKDNLLDWRLFLRAYAFLGAIEGLLSLGIFIHIWLRAGFNLSQIQNLSNSILYGTAPLEIMNLYKYSTTMAVAAIIACQIGNLFVCRSEKAPFWSFSNSKNSLLYYGLAFELLLSSAIIYIPFLQIFFNTTPIIPKDFLLLLACPIILIILEEIRKLVIRKRIPQSDSLLLY